jgi:GT2 family glycosyltransferase
MRKDTVTVLICTRNRPRSLWETLDSIRKHSECSYDQLLIVDSSDSPVDKEVKGISKIFGCVYLYEPRRGLSVARNRQIRTSMSDIIVLVDDDVVFASDSIAELVENLERGVAACTGRVLPLEADKGAMLFESALSFDRGSHSFEATPHDMKISSLMRSFGAFGKARLGNRTPLPFRVGYTPFCAFRKTVFDRVGYFDEHLGIGTSAEGGEDIDMFYRLLRNGYRIRYVSKAVVYHRHRTTNRSILLTAWRCGRGIRAVTGKYQMSDPYMFLICVGALTFFTLSSLRFWVKRSLQLAMIFRYELKGLIGASAPPR